MSDTVCPRCGWHSDRFGHYRRCWPAAGAAARRLILYCQQQGIEASQLGYGDHRVGVTFPNGMTVVFQIAEHGQDFEIVHTFGMHFDDNAVAKLIALLGNLSESEKAPEPAVEVGERRREWTIELMRFEMEPGKFATRSADIACPRFEAMELVLRAVWPVGGEPLVKGTYEDVRVHQLIIDDKPQRFINKRRRPADDTVEWVINLDVAAALHTVAVTLQNKGEVKRAVEVELRGFWRG